MKYSCLIFCVKMPEYSQIIYCLQKKLTHFSLEISVVCVKSSLYKINCFKYLLIYFLRRTVSRMKQEKNLNNIKSMCSIVLNILGQNFSKKSDKKNYIKSSCIIFLCQNDQIFTKISKLNQVFVGKCFNTSIMYT